MLDFFNSLTKLIKEYSKIIITTHKNMDLDGFASSLCLFNIINKMNKECYIYLNDSQSDTTINKTFEKLQKENYKFNILYKKNLKDLDFDNTLLIVLDVHKISLIENDELLNLISDIVVIDHHIKNIDYINKTKLMYINSNISSVSEIIVNYSKYMNYKTDSLLSTILLVAIEIDTNGFNFKTSETTYETAAYLTHLGANTIIKQEILRESKEMYLARQLYIERSYQINENIIACDIDDKIVSSKDLAIIADNLLQFENIEASFCIGKIDRNIVGISARSLGNIDVESIMRKLGGGGHLTEAATKLEDKTIKESKEMLINIIGG